MQSINEKDLRYITPVKIDGLAGKLYSPKIKEILNDLNMNVISYGVKLHHTSFKDPIRILNLKEILNRYPVVKLIIGKDDEKIRDLLVKGWMPLDEKLEKATDRHVKVVIYLDRRNYFVINAEVIGDRLVI